MSRWHVTHAHDLGDEIDRALVQAIFDGEKRTALSSRLGISTRQIRLRIGRLRDVTDSPSWAAFGASAVERGWVRHVAKT